MKAILFLKIVIWNTNYIIFAPVGGLAHLARVLAWQARGDRFESGILHETQKP